MSEQCPLYPQKRTFIIQRHQVEGGFGTYRVVPVAPT